MPGYARTALRYGAFRWGWFGLVALRYAKLCYELGSALLR